jgi:hypothetical protein
MKGTSYRILLRTEAKWISRMQRRINDIFAVLEGVEDAALIREELIKENPPK